jgi:hypothetical protein
VSAAKKIHHVETWVCIGVRWTSEEKLAPFFHCVSDSNIDYSVAAFGASSVKSAFAGGIYQIEFADEKSFYGSAAEYRGRWHDGELIATWEATERAARAQKEMKTAARKDMTRSAIQERLRPVIAAMRTTNAAGRAHLRRAVLEALEDI